MGQGNSSKQLQDFPDLPALATELRDKLQSKPVALLYAYNGTGKTRLSMEFKDLGRSGDERDTLYFNAYTEDLFTWDNDLDGDTDRRLRLNANSRFFAGFEELELDNRIRPLLQRYAEFDFRIDTEAWEVRFSRGAGDDAIDGIKISRGEERLFIWCFFLAILQLALDEAEAYKQIKYVYIDDPVSSLDHNHTIALANHLASVLREAKFRLPVVISTHHALFFDVVFNELHAGRKKSKAAAYVLQSPKRGGYELVRQGSELPFFHHVAILRELRRVADTGEIYTYHFNMLRSVLEKAAAFHGYRNFSACLRTEEQDENHVLHARYINILSHGNYSLYEPREMVDENKTIFCKLLKNFLEDFNFNPEAIGFNNESEPNEAAPGNTI